MLGTLYCKKRNCNYATKNAAELSYHIAKAHGAKIRNTLNKCVVCQKQFPSFYSLQLHRKKVHQASTKIGSSSTNRVREIMQKVDNDSESLKEELAACQHLLDDMHAEHGRQEVFNFNLSDLDTKEINKKLDGVFANLNCAAKINLALGFLLQNIKINDYRYYYPHENNLLLDRVFLVSNKNDLLNLQNEIKKLDLVETYTQERQNSKWRFTVITNVTVFVALLTNIPLGCTDSPLPEPLLRNPEVNCLVSNGHNEPYNDNLCLFRAIVIHLFGSLDVELHATEIFHNFITVSGCHPESFTGVSFDQIPIIEELIKQNIFIYDFDIEDGEIIGELVRRSVERYDENIKLLRYNNHICYVNDINKFFKKFRCPSCDVFFNHSGNFNRHLKTCKELVKNIYPRGAYSLRETLFEKLDNFSIAYPEDHTLFRNFVVFDFEAICVQSVKINNTATTSWIGTHVPVSVSISSNLLDEPVFLCEKDPNRLIISFVAQLEILAAKNKADLRPKFLAVEAEIKTRLSDIYSRLQIVSETQPNISSETEDSNVSKSFLQIQQKQLLDLQRHFNNYVDTLPVFGFNSGKYDLNLIKAYLIPHLLNDRDIQPTVIKKANQFISFKFDDIQFLDILNFLAGATSLDSFLKAYQSEETKGYFPYEWFDSFTKLDCNHLPPYDSFFSKLKNLNPLEKDLSQFKKMMESGKEEFDVLRELGLKEKPLSGKENHALLEKMWMMEKMTTFRDFLCWYNNKDVVPTLQAMKKMMKFYHDQKIDMLKLGCTLPNLANICLHKSTDRKFYPFIEADKDLHEKIRSEMTGGSSIVFTRKAVVDKTFIRRSNNICKTIVGIDASQLYPFSMCQAMPTGLYTRWEFDTNLQKFKAHQNKIRKFENMVISFYQATRPECTIESFYTTGKQRKIDSFTVDGFCGQCQTIFEALGCYYHFCPCRETRPNLNEDEFEFGIRKRESDKLRKLYLEKKGYKVIEMRECEWWDQVQEKSMLKNHIRKNFPYKLPLSKETLLTRIHEDKLFGYVQCDLKFLRSSVNDLHTFLQFSKTVMLEERI